MKTIIVKFDSIPAAVSSFFVTGLSQVVENARNAPDNSVARNFFFYRMVHGNGHPVVAFRAVLQVGNGKLENEMALIGVEKGTSSFFPLLNESRTNQSNLLTITGPSSASMQMLKCSLSLWWTVSRIAWT